MIPQIFAMLENHLWQSTLFAALAGLLTLALRGNRARVRHAVWLAASLKFLIPFAMLTWLGSQIEWRKPVASSPPTGFAVVLDEVSQPFDTLAPPPAAVVTRATIPWPTIILAIWVIGFLGIATSWLIRWHRIRMTVRAGLPIQLNIPIRAISSPTLLEPGVFGISRPVLLLPEGIVDCLTPAQLQSVIEHELCHVRHRDNLTATIQMFIETAFWFHPLVWWIGKRMVAERERACDEAAVSLGNEPHVYAEAILNVCKLYVESPLVCVAGVTGAGLKQRIESIVANRPLRRLNSAKRLLLATAAALTLIAPIAIGIINAPALHAQPASNSAIPKWEVVSVKACDGSAPVGRSGGGGGGRFSPGTLNANCAVPIRLIEEAYGFYANGRGPTWKSVPIEGAPAWLNSERYTIAAKAESPQGRAMMFGPMMQKLLEDRFKLRIRKEIREVPIYNLTIAKGGPKFLKASKPGTCVALDLDNPPPPQGDLCKMFSRRRVAEGEREFTEFGVNMAEFADGLAAMTGRNVIDKTGLSGTFDIAARVSLPDDPPRDPSQPRQGPQDESELVFAVVQKLGMKLESAKGPGMVYVIESIERPSDNFDPPIAKSESAAAPAASPVAAKPQRPPRNADTATPSQAPAKLEFEVVSVRLDNAGTGGAGDRFPKHGTWKWVRIPLSFLVMYAYDVSLKQIANIPSSFQSREVAFDITAKMPLDVTDVQFRMMLQSMLADRFKFAMHREIRDVAVTTIEIAKGGSKLQPAAGQCIQAQQSATPPSGQPRCGEIKVSANVRNGVITWQYSGRSVSVGDLAAVLSANGPVVDDTGIQGLWDMDVTVEYPQLPSTDDPDEASIREFEGNRTFNAAFEKQLGLSIDRGKFKKRPMAVIVVDHVEKPDAN
jgi:bla regulator protein blaR1